MLPISRGSASVIIPMIFVVLGVIGVIVFTGGELLGGLFEGLEWLPGGDGVPRKKTRTPPQ